MFRKWIALLFALFFMLTIVSCSSGLSSQKTSIAASLAFTVDQSGGVFTTSDLHVVMRFSSGSVGEKATIQVVPDERSSAIPGVIPGTAYAFAPEGTDFAQPVQLTVKYDPANLPFNFPENLLCLAKLIDISWQPVKGCTVDTANKTVTGSLDGFSTYGLVGSDMAVSFETPTCFPGSEVTITPHVKNAPPGYQLEYRWSIGGQSVGPFGEIVGTPDEKTGAITYKAKAQAPDGAKETVTLEIFTYFATADNPPKYTHYTWLTASTIVSMSFPTFSVESRTLAPNESVTLTPIAQNMPPGYKIQFRWKSDQKFGTLTPRADGSSATYKVRADAPDGAAESITVEMFSQFATADPNPIITDYVWDSVTATISIGILSFKFDLVQTMPGTQEKVTTHVWVRNHKVKMVTTGPASQSVVHLFDYDAHVEFWYTGNQGSKSSIDPSQKSPDDPAYLSQFAGYAKVGTEKVDGNSCRVLRSVVNETTSTVWIWEEKNLPMRMKIESSIGTILYEYKDYEFINIPEEEFMLPADVTIR